MANEGSWLHSGDLRFLAVAIISGAVGEAFCCGFVKLWSDLHPCAGDGPVLVRRRSRFEVEADRESLVRGASVAYPLNRFPRDNRYTVGRVLTFVCGAPDCEEIPPLFGLET